MIDYDQVKVNKSKLDKLQKTLDEQYKQLMLEGVQFLFEEHPTLKSISFDGDGEYDDENYSYGADLYDLRIEWINDDDIYSGNQDDIKEYFREVVELFEFGFEKWFDYSTVTFYKDRIETYE